MSSFMLPESHPLFGCSGEHLRIAYTQLYDYDCGPTAVAFLLGCDPAEVRRELPHTEKDGTHPDDIMVYLMLKKNKFPKQACRGVMPCGPLLVNYQHKFPDGTIEGHYGVIVASSAEFKYTVFDPWIGGFFKIRDAAFACSWYSKRYYDRWGIWVEPSVEISPWLAVGLQ
jgi:hypothetical protein